MNNEIIYKRKSIRKYDQAKLDSETLNKLQGQIDQLLPLYPSIRYSVEIADKTKGMFNVKAPHYLLFRSAEKEGALENIGFIGQQLDLFFSKSGLGSCWLGAAKPGTPAVVDMPFVIAIGFGKPAEPLHRDITEFKRKSLDAISEGKDSRLESARLAPSGMNMQGWHFIATGSKIHCYRKKAMLAFISRMSTVDMGIALWHIASESESFRFMKEPDAPARKGFIYAGTVL